MSYECEARPKCPDCGAPWTDEMVAWIDAALGLGCACCNPFADQIPDIVCQGCKKVLYTTRGDAAANAPAPELNLDPDP